MRRSRTAMSTIVECARRSQPTMRRASLIAAAVVLALAAPRAAGTRPITETDILKFTWIADPQISPDGRTIAFVRVTVNEKENRYETSIFAVAASGGEAPRRLTT